MKKLAIILLIPSLAGCVSWNNQASLTTRFNNASKSIQDLGNSHTKEIIDTDTNQSIRFYYNDDPNSKNLKKITSIHKINQKYKEVINLYIKDGSINLANLEIHNQENGYTDLQNYSFTIENNQVKEVIIKDEYQDELSNEIDQKDSITSQINQHIEYISTTYLNESI